MLPVEAATLEAAPFDNPFPSSPEFSITKANYNAAKFKFVYTQTDARAFCKLQPVNLGGDLKE